jgi:hypothetical protein
VVAADIFKNLYKNAKKIFKALKDVYTPLEDKK